VVVVPAVVALGMHTKDSSLLAGAELARRRRNFWPGESGGVALNFVWLRPDALRGTRHAIGEIVLGLCTAVKISSVVSPWFLRTRGRASDAYSLNDK